MFDIGSYELLIIAVVILLVVGPKDLPVFLRTVGKYVGAAKRQASEFRQQFEEALKDTELDQLRKDVAAMKTDVEGSIRGATKDLEKDVADADKAIRSAGKSVSRDPLADKPKAVPANDEGPAAEPSRHEPPRQDEPPARAGSGDGQT